MTSVAQPRGDGAQALATCGREFVVPRPSIVVARAPLGGEPAAAFHALEGLIERAVVDAERAVRAVLEPGGDGVAVHRAPAQCFEDEEVEGALEERQRVVRHSSFPVSAKGNMRSAAQGVKANGSWTRTETADGDGWCRAHSRVILVETEGSVRRASHPEGAGAQRTATEGSLSIQGFQLPLARQRSFGCQTLRADALRMTRAWSGVARASINDD